MEAGLNFQDQKKQACRAIVEEFNCSEEEAEFHFYPNALKEVIALATESDQKKRKTTKASFRKKIDHCGTLFNVWYIYFMGKRKYLQVLRGEITATKALYGPKDKALFIDSSCIPLDSPQLNITAFIQNLTGKYYRTGTTKKTDKPWTIYITGEPGDIAEVKANLAKGGIAFNDGLEHLTFTPDIFNESPVCEFNKYRRLQRVSYSVRILSSKTLKTFRDNITQPDVLLFISQQLDPTDYFTPERVRQTLQLPYLESLVELGQLIT